MQLEEIKHAYGLAEAEIHVGWKMRPYAEQQSIPGFSSLTEEERRSEVVRARTAELLRLQRTNRKQYRQTRKNYRKTEQYVHLTVDERRQIVRDLARLISGWGVARLFAECIDKLHFNPVRVPVTIDEQAFEQVVTRFEHFLRNARQGYGLLIHDNNQTLARRHTEMMKRFLRTGTLWTQVEHVIETPMFVDSELTNMVQLADLCAYALRRYLENSERELFDLVFERADRAGGALVGIRHFTTPDCACMICLPGSRSQSRIGR